MSRFVIRFFTSLLAGWISLGAVEAREVVGRGDIVVVPLQGEVAPSLALFLRRAEKEAEANGASAIILDMVPPLLAQTDHLRCR